MESQQSILYHQTRLPLPGIHCIQFSLWPNEPHGNPQTTQVIAWTLGSSEQTDSVEPHCQWQHQHKALNMEKLNWGLHGAFSSTL